MTDEAMEKRKAKTDAETSVERVDAGRSETVFVPDVDISEDDACVRLLADMPGVDPATANVTVENGVLTIEGQAGADGPQGYELVGQEYGTGRYRRDFTLSDAIDTANIKARVRHGVLDVTLPKHESVKTRKVEIES